MKKSLFERRVIGIAARLFSPGYSACGMCGRPWNVCEEHTTQYTENSGVFHLCQDCWEDLDPASRLPFYREVWQSWMDSAYPCEEKWEDIEAAVLAGK